MSDYKHKLVNGELIELTPEEIAELEQRDKDAPETKPEPEEPADAKRKPRR